MKKTFLGTTLTCIIIDQLIKILVKQHLEYQASIPIIEQFFNLTYVKNEGAAWSILNGNHLFLIIIAVIALIGIYYYLIKQNTNKEEEIAIGILSGGIIGNMIDRILHGYVIDYLDFNIFGYPFPVFNFADICIVLAVIWIIKQEWSSEKNENTESRNGI